VRKIPEGYISIEQLFGNKAMDRIYELIGELCNSEEMIGNTFMNTVVDYLSSEGKFSEVLLRLGKDETELQKIFTDLLLYSFDNYFSSFVKLNRPLSPREKATYCGFRAYVYGRQGNESLEFLVMAHRELISNEQLEKVYAHHVTALHDFLMDDWSEGSKIAS
jgi:hypothetical protein